MSDSRHADRRRIVEGALELIAAGAPRAEVEAEGLIRVDIERLDLDDAERPSVWLQISSMEGALNALTEDVTSLQATASRLDLHTADHDTQLDGVIRTCQGLRELIDRLIDRVSAVAESAQAGDGMIREDLIERIEALEDRLAVPGEGETFVMGEDASALTRAEILARGIPCQVCGAKPGEACHDETLADLQFAHTSRLEQARAEVDARGRA